MAEKYLVGYRAYRDDLFDVVRARPIYSNAEPPVGLQEEYLSELVMRLWYRLNVEHTFSLPDVTVRVHGASHLTIGCTDNVYKNVGITVYRHTVTYEQLLNGIARRVARAVCGRISQANKQLRRMRLKDNLKYILGACYPSFYMYSRYCHCTYPPYDLRMDFEDKYETWRREQ